MVFHDKRIWAISMGGQALTGVNFERTGVLLRSG